MLLEVGRLFIAVLGEDEELIVLLLVHDQVLTGYYSEVFVAV